ncbi:hypothetical protein C6Y14_02395 [Streptomyces dioscori]|uniref:Uncharacterized protein n=1 Tax=Streptomyces dioscori TaxID=2109333 RepID=A0A2P8QFD5_9ACTN|nr:hypothetical protein C6Y14_02395 [Streptomyces dioscori]
MDHGVRVASLSRPYVRGAPRVQPDAEVVGPVPAPVRATAGVRAFVADFVPAVAAGPVWRV